MLAGKVPFSGSVNEVIGKVLHVEPAPPSSQRAGVDPQLEAICVKAMAKAPGERYASMKALAEVLDGFLKGMPAAELAKPATARNAEGGQLTKVVQALSAERREETRAVIEEAVRRARIPIEILPPTNHRRVRDGMTTPRGSNSSVPTTTMSASCLCLTARI